MNGKKKKRNKKKKYKKKGEKFVNRYSESIQVATAKNVATGAAMWVKIGTTFRRPFLRTLPRGRKSSTEGWRGLHADDKRESIGRSRDCSSKNRRQRRRCRKKLPASCQRSYEDDGWESAVVGVVGDAFVVASAVATNDAAAVVVAVVVVAAAAAAAKKGIRRD